MLHLNEPNANRFSCSALHFRDEVSPAKVDLWTTSNCFASRNGLNKRRWMGKLWVAFSHLKAGVKPDAEGLLGGNSCGKVFHLRSGLMEKLISLLLLSQKTWTQESLKARARRRREVYDSKRLSSRAWRHVWLESNAPELLLDWKSFLLPTHGLWDAFSRW